jgi:two-component system phosphate regulon sensor histidine kinase PhoR
VRQAYSQLKWEVFHQDQALAEELAARIKGRLAALIRAEEERSFEDYGFLVVTGDPSATFLQRSPLAAFPVKSDIPGLLGYFQVDTEGALTTPLLPPPGKPAAAYGLSGKELRERAALADRIRSILSRNRLLAQPGAAAAMEKETAEARREEYKMRAPAAQESPAAEGASQKAATKRPRPSAQAAFDQLNAPRQTPTLQKQKKSPLGRVEDLNLDLRFQDKLAEAPAATGALAGAAAPRQPSLENELRVEPEPQAAPLAKAPARQASPDARGRVHIFDSELGPYELSLLDSGQFVLFRNVWRGGQRFIQGALIEQKPFLKQSVESLFRETTLSRITDLVVAYQGAVLAAFGAQPGREYLTSAQDLGGALLYRTRLAAPLSALELIFTVKQLPVGPGGRVVGWTAVTLTLVLTGGFFLMYRSGLRQIALTRQQQDFVSAVSHELKTPLTSIRLYGEMLKEGWATEDRKETYYDYICAESERLTRLIENVLQLARLTRNELRVELKPVPVGELMERLRPKIATQIERAGFELRLDCPASNAVVHGDQDFFAQILINLVDNALKFSRDAECRAVQVGCRMADAHSVRFWVRDYGPGIPRDQMKKIFRLFYRSGNELSRETVGTGIGLALVRQLTLAMNGHVDVVNRNPGAELRLTFPAGPIVPHPPVAP